MSVRTDWLAALRRTPATVWALAVLCACLALAPASTKVAGLGWLLLCVLGGVAAWRLRQPVPDAATAAARVWAWGCTAALLLSLAKVAIWRDPIDGLNAEMRLALAAWATLAVVRFRPAWSEAGVRALRWALVLQCAVALPCVAVLVARYGIDARGMLTTNAIPWGVMLAMTVCVLAPWLLGWRSLAPRTRWGLVAGVLAGLLAIALCRSRGAFAVLPWLALLPATAWHRQRGRTWAALGAAALAVAGFLAAAWWAPGDPLRFHEARKELQSASHGDYNTSMGNRVYLWQVAWQRFTVSPWIGVGQRERMRLIKQAGSELPPAQQQYLQHVRTMGHVHNQYLHAAFDGGILFLSATLAFIAALGLAAWRLWPSDRTAARQLGGVVVVHALASLTNVNFAHNYYAVSLALVVAVVLVTAAWRQRPP